MGMLNGVLSSLGLRIVVLTFLLPLGMYVSSSSGDMSDKWCSSELWCIMSNPSSLK